MPEKQEVQKETSGTPVEAAAGSVRVDSQNSGGVSPVLRPTEGRLIIRKDPPKAQEGIIAIPDEAQKKSRFATVVAVWEGSKVRVGQRIFTAQYKGTPIEGIPEARGLDIILERDIYLFID